MKKNILFALSALFISSSFAGLTPKREALYNCVNYDESSEVYGLTVYESYFRRGKVFHEVEVIVDSAETKNSFKKVNLINIYEGRIQHFTTGNFRVKIDRVQKNEDGHMKTFARIPQFEIHSKNWSCKDAR